MSDPVEIIMKAIADARFSSSHCADALAILSALEAEGWKLVRREPSAEVRAALNTAHAWGKER